MRLNTRDGAGWLSDVVITPEDMDDALARCLLCGGPLRDDDDTVHSRLADCRAREDEED